MDNQSKPHILIFTPGLGNSTLSYYLFKWHFRNSNLDVRLVKMDWTDGENFEQKLNRLLSAIRRFREEGKQVSLIGISAGGTMAIAAFTESPGIINKVITVSSPIVTDGKEHPMLERQDRGIPIVKAALTKLHFALPQLTDEQKKRVMTFRPLYDFIVPPACTILEGAINIKMPVVGHTVSIRTPEWKYAKEIVEFINKQ